MMNSILEIFRLEYLRDTYQQGDQCAVGCMFLEDKSEVEILI